MTQGKPDLAKTALAEACGDDGADIAVGASSSAAAIAMLPVAEKHQKMLIVEPAVADENCSIGFPHQRFTSGAWRQRRRSGKLPDRAGLKE